MIALIYMRKTGREISRYVPHPNQKKSEKHFVIIIHIIIHIIHTYAYTHFLNMILEENVLSLAVFHIVLGQETLNHEDFGCLGFS